MAFTEMTARTLKRPRQPWTSEGALRALDACDVFAPFIGFNLAKVVRTLTGEGTAGRIGEADPAIGIAQVALVDGGLSCLACLVSLVVGDCLACVVEDAAKHLRLIMRFWGFLVAELHDIASPLNPMCANELTGPLDVPRAWRGLLSPVEEPIEVVDKGDGRRGIQLFE